MASGSRRAVPPTLTTIVLAGGKSLRLGRDKSREVVGGEALLSRVLRVVTPLSAEVLLSVSRESPPPADVPGVRIVIDTAPGKGVLGGLHTTLMASHTWHNLVVACDMPFLSAELLRYMAGLARGYDLVVPRLDGQTEPLHAIYSKGCVGPIARLLEQGHLRIAGLFPLVRLRYVEQDEVERHDPERFSFLNVNTEADLERARRVSSGGAPGQSPGQDRGQAHPPHPQA